MHYIEELKRTEDDSHVETVATQCVGDLHSIRLGSCAHVMHDLRMIKQKPKRESNSLQQSVPTEQF